MNLYLDHLYSAVALMLVWTNLTIMWAILND